MRLRREFFRSRLQRNQIMYKINKMTIRSIKRIVVMCSRGTVEVPTLHYTNLKNEYRINLGNNNLQTISGRLIVTKEREREREKQKEGFI